MRVRTIGRRQEIDNIRLFVMQTGEAYHRIVQIILKLVSNFVISGSRHARYMVCYPLDVMYEMKNTHCGRGLADNLIEDKTRDYIAFLTIISNNPIKHSFTICTYTYTYGKMVAQVYQRYYIYSFLILSSLAVIRGSKNKKKRKKCKPI
jgi:hypothetical protein